MLESQGLREGFHSTIVVVSIVLGASSYRQPIYLARSAVGWLVHPVHPLDGGTVVPWWCGT
jgi:hypothetical protein